MLLIAIILNVKCIGNKDKTLTIKEYLDMTSPYLSNIINDHKTQGEWKIYLTIQINLYEYKKWQNRRYDG